MVADAFRRTADDPTLRRRLNFDHVVRHQAVPAGDELQSALALADTARTPQQDTYAANIDERPVNRHARILRAPRTRHLSGRPVL